MKDISSNIPPLVVRVRDNLKLCRQVHYKFIIPANVRPGYMLFIEKKMHYYKNSFTDCKMEGAPLIKL